MKRGRHDMEHAKKTTKHALERAAGQAQLRRWVPRSLRQRFVWGIAVLMVLIVVGTIVWWVRSLSDEIPGIVTSSNLARTHVTLPVTYPEIPPVGGTTLSDMAKLWHV